MSQSSIEFMKECTYIVEATSVEQSYLWNNWKDKGLTFNNAGIVPTVGHLDDRPICLSFFTAEYKGHKILMWHPTSQLVDYQMIEEFFKENFENYSQRSTDAQNFHNAIHHIDRVVEEAQKETIKHNYL